MAHEESRSKKGFSGNTHIAKNMQEYAKSYKVLHIHFHYIMDRSLSAFYYISFFIQFMQLSFTTHPTIASLATSLFPQTLLDNISKKKKRMAKLSRNVFPVVSRPGQTENVNAFSLVMLSNVFGLYSNHAMPNDNHKGTALNSVFLV